MTNILFVNPFFMKDSALERDWMMPYFPLGTLYLAAAVREARHEARVFDGTFQHDDSGFVDMLIKFQPEVVCITSMITLRPAALQLGAVAAAHGALVIYGGPDPTNEPSIYSQSGGIVVIGEGENTLVDLLDARTNSRPLDSVKGIAYQRDGAVIHTEDRDPIWDLDSLAFPARDLINPAPYLDVWQTAHGYRSVTLAVSRGCPYNCEYCANSAVGLHFRRRSVANVVAEMQTIERDIQPDSFRLVDDLDGLGRDWLVELGDAMLQAGITTPYEGLRPTTLSGLPMYQSYSALCGKRNKFIPPQSDHPHASPALDASALLRRWRDGVLHDD